MDVDDPRPFFIARAAMVGLMCPTIFVIWVVSMCMARRRADPARVAFSWFKAIPPFALLYFLLVITHDAAYIGLVTYQLDPDLIWTTDTTLSLRLVILHANGIADLFQRIASALLLITLVELGNGFMYARTGQRTKSQKIFRYLSYFAAVVLVVVALAGSVRYNAPYAEYLRSVFGYGNYSNSKLRAALKDWQSLYLAHDILHWIILMLTIAYASVVVHLYRSQGSGRGNAAIFLTVTILNFVRYTYLMATDITWSNPNGSNEFYPYYALILDAIFVTWLFSVVLIMIFAIGVKKGQGLWSTAQPFHNGMGPTPFAGNGEAKPVPMAYGTAPMGYQAPVGYQQAPMGYVPAPMGYQAPVGYQPGAPAGWQPQQPQPIHHTPGSSPPPPAQYSTPPPVK